MDQWEKKTELWKAKKKGIDLAVVATVRNFVSSKR